MVEFEGIGSFGKPHDTKVIYAKLKDKGLTHDLLSEINDLLVRSMLKNKVIEEGELSHLSLNPATGRYELDQMHITLMNSAFAKRDL